MASSGSAVAAPPARVLTPAEQVVVDTYAALQGIGADMLLPNDTFITTTPYGSPWYNSFLKEFIQSDGDMNANLAMLNHFEALLARMPKNSDTDKKKLSVGNRKKELFEKALKLFQAGNPRTFDKAACVIIRPDNQCLYVYNQGNRKLGYPKGDVDIFLQNPNDINTFHLETPVEAALRELQEETGFAIRKPFDLSTSPHAITLSDGIDTLNIVNSRAEEGIVSYGTDSYRTFYLILFTDTNVPLNSNSVPARAQSEGIIGKHWEIQYTAGNRVPYNEYSKLNIPYDTTFDATPKKRANTYMGGRKRRYRKKTMRRRKHAKKHTRKH